MLRPAGTCPENRNQYWYRFEIRTNHYSVRNSPDREHDLAVHVTFGDTFMALRAMPVRSLACASRPL
jgi:hypothetical protein